MTRHGGYSTPPYNPARAAGKGFSFPSRRGPSSQEDLNGTGLPSYSLPLMTVKLLTLWLSENPDRSQINDTNELLKVSATLVFTFFL